MYIVNLSENIQEFENISLPPLGYVEIDKDDLGKLPDNDSIAFFKKLPTELKNSLDEFFKDKIDLIDKVKTSQDIISEDDFFETSSRLNYFLEDYENDFDIAFPDEGLRIIVNPSEDSKVLYNLATMYFNEVPKAKYNPEDWSSVKECFEGLTGYSLDKRVEDLIQNKLKG